MAAEEDRLRKDEEIQRLKLACAAVAAAPQARPTKTTGGVYVIAHLASGREYIGVTTNFKRRMSHHMTLLKMLRHSNRPLQRDWNADGADGFRYGLVSDAITKAEIALAPVLERRLIASCDPAFSYNVMTMAERRVTPEGENLKPRVLKMTAEDWALFHAAGGLEWLRAVIRRARPPG